MEKRISDPTASQSDLKAFLSTAAVFLLTFNLFDRVAPISKTLPIPRINACLLDIFFIIKPFIKCNTDTILIFTCQHNYNTKNRSLLYISVFFFITKICTTLFLLQKQWQFIHMLYGDSIHLTTAAPWRDFRSSCFLLSTPRTLTSHSSPHTAALCAASSFILLRSFLPEAVTGISSICRRFSLFGIQSLGSSLFDRASHTSSGPASLV